MRKTRKTIALMFATVMAMSAMSGCSSNSANTTTSAETKADDTKAEDAKADGKDTAKDAKADKDLTGSVTAAGSSALKPLVDEAADLFSEKYPDVSLTIDAGGSGEGLKQVAEGTVNIGNLMFRQRINWMQTRQKSLSIIRFVL